MDLLIKDHEMIEHSVTKPWDTFDTRGNTVVITAPRNTDPESKLPGIQDFLADIAK